LKTRLQKNRNRAITLIEVLIIVVVLILLVAILVPISERAMDRSIRMCCVNSLKQTGLAFQVWSGDNHGDFPMGIPQAQGGTKEFVTGPNAYRHSQVMSNELSTPIVVICPADVRYERMATNFAYLNNSNISFLIGVDAHPTNRSTILAGDRNITNRTAVRNGMLELTAANPTSWTAEMHKNVGNLVFADGSVDQVSVADLQNAVATTGVPTNLLQMPILGP
jgi:prepilin-type processing-associated H-X9-DG protein